MHLNIFKKRKTILKNKDGLLTKTPICEKVKK